MRDSGQSIFFSSERMIYAIYGGPAYRIQIKLSMKRWSPPSSKPDPFRSIPTSLTVRGNEIGTPVVGML